MKFFVVSVLAYALVAKAAVLPVTHIGKIGHEVATGVATSVGHGTAAGVHAVVHGAEKVGAAVVGTGLGALELGSEVASGIKVATSVGLGTAALVHAHKLHKDVDFHKRDEHDNGFGCDKTYPSHEHKEHGSHEHKEHGGHETHEHGKHNDWHKHEKRAVYIYKR